MVARRARTAVAVVGDSEPLAELRHALGRTHRVAIAAGLAEPGYDAVLLEARPGDDPARRLAEVRDLTAAPVVLLAPAPSPALVEWALDAGVADVLAAPYQAGGVLFALEKAVRTDRGGETLSVGRVVTVFSPKGGSGKSTIASNLGALVARRGARRTLLVDLDLQFGDAAIMLGLAPAKTLRELVASPAELDSETLDVYTIRHRSGLDVLAAPLHPEEAELVGESVVRNVLSIARATHDLVVVDTPPFFHATTLASLDATDELLLVCTPDIAAVKNVRLALATLEQLALPTRVRLVLNRDGDRGALTTAEVTDALGRSPDVLLPFDPEVPAGVNSGTPAVLAAARGPFAQAVSGLARTLFPEDWPPLPSHRPVLPRRRRFAFARS